MVGTWETTLNPFIRDKTVLFVLLIDFVSTWTCENDFTVENDNIIDFVLSKTVPSQRILLGVKKHHVEIKHLKKK